MGPTPSEMILTLAAMGVGFALFLVFVAAGLFVAAWIWRKAFP